MDEWRLMESQYGVISRAQARTVGVSDDAVDRRVAKGQWQRLLPGLFRHTASPVSDRMLVRAALLWLGPDAVLWGAWAAWWHELLPEPVGPLGVTVPRTSNGRSNRLVAVRRRDLGAADVTILHQVKVTTRQLTALECAHSHRTRGAFDRALQKHLVVSELTGPVERMWHGYGVVAARAAVDSAGDGTVSHPERRLAAALRTAGITELRAGVMVSEDAWTYRIDFAATELKLAIEIDGHQAHTQPEQFEKDRRRQNDLVRAGWTVLRYTPWQIRNELPRVVAEIRDTLRTLSVSA